MEPKTPMPNAAASATPITRLAWLALGVGMALRAGAGLAAERVARRRGDVDLFPDAKIYWELSRAIRAGGPFAVNQWGVPHYALRTPGYPLFLALFGDTLPARLAQAALGGLAAWLVGRLVERLRPGAGVAAIAVILAALDPWAAGIAAVILSEPVFLPLMVAGLWGLATLWNTDEADAPRHPILIGLATGAATGAAILVKPSWALFMPAAAATWVATARGHRRQAVSGAMAVGLGMAIVMAPWWIRNGPIYGRFVPTALWLGASLYDGLNPGATGGSDMEFLNAPDVRALGEVEQDALLRTRASRWATAHPGAALRLAAAKAARYWSPWPNAESFRVPWVDAALATLTLPAFALMALGAWDRRRDARALVLLAGPLLYFGAIHLVFASSVRYRIPGELPALGLAAIGVRRLWPGRPTSQRPGI